MSLSDFPPEVLMNIFSNIRFKERAILSEVCRRWHDVIFNLMPGDYTLKMFHKYNHHDKFAALLARNKTRTYRTVDIDLEEMDPEEGSPDQEEFIVEEGVVYEKYLVSIDIAKIEVFLGEVNDSLDILAKRDTVRHLRLLSSHMFRLIEFFKRHRDFLDSLEKLEVTIENSHSEINLEGVQLEVPLSKLKYLVWNDYEYHERMRYDSPVIIVDIPQATQVMISRVYPVDRDRSLLAIKRGDSIQKLKIGNWSEYCAREFFRDKRSELRELELEKSINDATRNEIQQIVQNIPNVTSLRFGYLRDNHQQAICFAKLFRNLTSLSLKVLKVDLSILCSNLRSLTTLKKLILRCEDQCFVGHSTILRLPHLVEFRCNIFSYDLRGEPIKLHAPLSSFNQLTVLSDCNLLNPFSLPAVDHPQLREFSFQWIPSFLDFFRQQSFTNLRKLSCCFPTIQPELVDEIDARLQTLHHLTLQFFQFHNHEVNRLLSNVFNNCTSLTYLRLEDFAIPFGTFADIVRLNRLTELHLLNGKIYGPVERQLTIDRLRLLTVRDVVVFKDHLDSFLVRTEAPLFRYVKGDKSLNSSWELSPSKILDF